MAPYQALFLSPCSHAFHYKCVTPLLGAGFMFQCPMCRQVANLEACVASEDMEEDNVYSEDESQHESSSDEDLAVQTPLNRIIRPSSDAIETEQQLESVHESTHASMPLSFTNMQADSNIISPKTPPNNSWGASENAMENSEPLTLYRILNDFEASLRQGDIEQSKSLLSSYSSIMKRFLSNVEIAGSGTEEIRDELMSVWKSS
jgi:hypothetical protein